MFLINNFTRYSDEKANKEALERIFGCDEEAISIEEMKKVIANGWAGIE